MQDTIVVSAHLDDAVLSCYSALGPSTSVVTVFAGLPPESVLSSWDAEGGATSSRERMAERREEDRRALARLRSAVRPSRSPIRPVRGAGRRGAAESFRARRVLADASGGCHDGACPERSVREPAAATVPAAAVLRPPVRPRCRSRGQAGRDPLRRPSLRPEPGHGWIRPAARPRRLTTGRSGGSSSTTLWSPRSSRPCGATARSSRSSSRSSATS